MIGNHKSLIITESSNIAVENIPYNLQSGTIPVPTTTTTGGNSTNAISTTTNQGKRRSVFANRQIRNLRSQEEDQEEQQTVTESSPLPNHRNSLPEIEQVTTAVIKSEIIERSGVIQPPITTYQFPAQPKGFPIAAHRSQQSKKPQPSNQLSNHAELSQLLTLSTTSLTDEQLDIHRNSMEMIADYGDVQIDHTIDHINQSLRPEVISMLLQRAQAKYCGDASSTDALTNSSGSNLSSEIPSPSQNIPQPTDLNEIKKLEWTKDIDITTNEPASKFTNKEDPNDPLTHTSTIPGSSLRFDLAGILLENEPDIPMHLGLHHHSHQPEMPGYSIPELVHLLRSRFSAQRLIAVKVLGEIFALVWQKHAYGPQTSVILACIHATAAIVQLRGLVLDTNTSVCLHTLITLYELLKPGLDAVQVNRWDGVHIVVMNPVLLVASEHSYSEPACDTMTDHIRNLKSNLPGGLLAMDLVPDLCKLLIRQQPVLTPLVLNILGILCIQMQHACKQIINEFFEPVLAEAFKSLEAFIASPNLCSASTRDIENRSVLIHLLRTLVLYEPKLMADQVLNNKFNIYLLKVLSIPPNLVELSPIMTASMQFILTLINYGDSTHVSEIIQILHDHHLKCPGTYAIARAIKTHVPDLAILTVPIVDHAYIYLQNTLTPTRIAELPGLLDYEMLIETGSLVAARNVPIPVNDLMGVVNSLVQVILDQLDQMSASGWELVNYLQHRPDHIANTFQIFPYNTGPLMDVVCNPKLNQPIHLLELILRQFPDPSIAKSTLETIKSTLIIPIFHSGQLWQVSMLVSILVTYVSHKDLLADAVDHLIAYYAITFLNVPREHHLVQLKNHIREITAECRNPNDNVWQRILHPNNLGDQIVQRENLYLSLPIPSIDRVGLYPSTIECRTWLLHPSTSAARIPDLHVISIWHAQLSLTHIPWLTSTDLACIFLDPKCPYLTYSEEMATVCQSICGGISDPVVFDMVMDAFINLSYFAPVFQKYLLTVLFDTSSMNNRTTDSVRVQFFSQMYEAGTLSRLRLGADATFGGGGREDLGRFKLSATTDNRDLGRLLRVALQYVPKDSVWFQVIAMQDL